MPNPVERLTAALADRYAIERELGAGGMATVYLAEDLKHERKVAVKVLKPELSAILGAERFLNEIRVTAHLQHPHILQLYDSGSADGLLFYVMPYVEGESLRERLSRERQLPVDEAVEIVRAVAGALDYAHRHRVIHRDIKPENILLHEGQPLVADFGIALAVSAAGGSRLTETGLSLGTPHYMSPEQATGDRALDGRSDIYSLGCVAYEMLAGEPPHVGPTAQAVIAKIITEMPRRLGLARPAVPPHVEAAIHKALEKLHADRFATAAQLAEALARPLTAAALAAAPAARPAGPAATVPRALAAILRTHWRFAAGLVALTLLAGLLIGRRTAPTPSPSAELARFRVGSVSGQYIGVAAAVQNIAISSDGSRIAYIARTARGVELYVRPLESLTPAALSGTAGALNPVFSPDGQWLAFAAGGQVKKVSLAGGTAVPVPRSEGAFPIAWDERGLVVTRIPGVLLRLPEEASVPETLATAEQMRELRFGAVPAILLGGRALVAAVREGAVTGRLVAVTLPGMRRKTLLESGVSGVRYSPTGHLLYVLGDGTLMAAPFDARRLELTGLPVTIAQGIRIVPGGVPQFAVSGNGALVYLPEQPFELVVVDRAGAARLMNATPRTYHSPRFSPDGRRVAVDVVQQGRRDVWVQDLQEGTFTRLTFDNDGHDPVWTPDGRRVRYLSARSGALGIYLMNIDGSGAAESLYAGEEVFWTGASLPDGSRLVYVGQTVTGGSDLFELPLPGERRPQPLLATPFGEGWPAPSPDGRWLAYVSDESGQAEVYVRPMDGEGRLQVSLDGGTEPVWARSGRELFYRRLAPAGPQLVAAQVTTIPAFRVVSRTPLFDVGDYDGAVPHANYDVHPDGQRFVMVRQPTLSEMILVQNWPLLARRQR